MIVNIAICRSWTAMNFQNTRIFLLFVKVSRLDEPAIHQIPILIVTLERFGYGCLCIGKEICIPVGNDLLLFSFQHYPVHMRCIIFHICKCPAVCIKTVDRSVEGNFQLQLSLCVNLIDRILWSFHSHKIQFFVFGNKGFTAEKECICHRCITNRKRFIIQKLFDRFAVIMEDVIQFIDSPFLHICSTEEDAFWSKRNLTDRVFTLPENCCGGSRYHVIDKQSVIHGDHVFVFSGSIENFAILICHGSYICILVCNLC